MIDNKNKIYHHKKGGVTMNENIIDIIYEKFDTAAISIKSYYMKLNYSKRATLNFSDSRFEDLYHHLRFTDTSITSILTHEELLEINRDKNNLKEYCNGNKFLMKKIIRYFYDELYEDQS